MNNKKTKIALFVVGILMVVSIVSGLILPYFKNKDNNSVTPNGQIAEEKIFVPDFVFTDAQGEEFNLHSFSGKPTVINFWSIYCPYCLIELEDFDKIVAEYGEDVNFIFMNVANHPDETVDSVEDYLANSEFGNISTYYDTYLQGCYMFGITGFPMTAYIDSEGYLSNFVPGMTNYDDIKASLDNML